MTEKSRIVLQDVEYAIENHNKKLQSESFRVSWVSIITLLRAIGHVLNKVDSQTSPEMKKAIKQKWEILCQSKPEPKIFWGFICNERNRFLKEYKHGITRILTVPSLVDGVYISADGANSRGGEFSPGSEYESFISTGPFEGRYEKDVALEATNWWKLYLDDVDDLVEEYNRSSI